EPLDVEVVLCEAHRVVPEVVGEPCLLGELGEHPLVEIAAKAGPAALDLRPAPDRGQVEERDLHGWSRRRRHPRGRRTKSWRWWSRGARRAQNSISSGMTRKPRQPGGRGISRPRWRARSRRQRARRAAWLASSALWCEAVAARRLSRGRVRQYASAS